MGGIALSEDRGLEELLRGREALRQLAQTEDARRLMELLHREGGVQEAARAAARGDAGALTGMMDRLMRSQEGRRLVEQIQARAKQAGLE